MATIEKSIEVDAPLEVTYNQWTQFEEFPRFMEGVKQVTQLDDTRLHWRANVAGQTNEWYARITDEVPDDRTAWTAEGGTFPPASSLSTGSATTGHGSCSRWSTRPSTCWKKSATSSAS